MDKYCEYCKNDERHRKIKLIISIEKDLYEMIKDCVEHGQNYDYFEIIANGIPYEERPQGEWEEINERIGTLGEDNIYTSFKCPFCGHIDLLDNNYCGNCGADLRGKEE